MHDIASIYVWLGFAVFLIIALGIDTYVVNQRSVSIHKSLRVALGWSALWIICALIFNTWLWWYVAYKINYSTANQVAFDFFTGYLIEKSLSIDNLFIFYVIFQTFKIPGAYQQRVLSYGIWSAVVFRLVLILFGTWLVHNFNWLFYVMGLFLLVSGINTFWFGYAGVNFKKGVIYSWIKRNFRITTEFEGQIFFIKKPEGWYATPLLLALIWIEISDLFFAFDSIPAVFAITLDPFIVWTSNIFAILGLRVMYFILAGMIERLYLLKYGIGLILIFLGLKMVSEPWFKISTGFSLGIVVGILVVFGGLSVIGRKFKFIPIISKLQYAKKLEVLRLKISSPTLTEQNNVTTEITNSADSPAIITLDDYAFYLTPRNRDWHKHLSGNVLVIGGEVGYLGAPCMAAQAALRVGAGLVTVATREYHAGLVALSALPLMYHVIGDLSALKQVVAAADVVILGPGLGKSNWAFDICSMVCDTLQRSSAKLILDADGLNWLALTSSSTNYNLNAAILTPHAGEAARLLGGKTTASWVQQHRVQTIQQLRERYGGNWILKGKGSLVASQNLPLAICMHGNPGMATAGMGDILSGVVGGLAAQGLELEIVARLGVCLHAKAGDLAAGEGERGMLATDILPYLRQLSNLESDND